MNSQFLVITDLDGTLLDHHTYSWEQASEALEMLRSTDIPLVLCSSKTAAEMLELRKALGNHHPFIVENGGAIYLPGTEDEQGGFEKIDFGMNRAEVLARLDHAREEADVIYTGFNDMGVEDVMSATGLDESSAANARQREFTEPLLWQDSEEKRRQFIAILEKSGLAAVQGGRFMHVSAGCDKGKAVAWLKGYYADRTGAIPQVIALGDSENDVSMLEVADYPVLVKSPVKAYPVFSRENVYRTSATGPAGWNEAIKHIVGK